jgi:hypothetical protein
MQYVNERNRFTSSVSVILNEVLCIKRILIETKCFQAEFIKIGLPSFPFPWVKEESIKWHTKFHQFIIKEQ